MISLFDLFKIGIGPSSSHTVGPMKAAYAFIQELSQEKKLPQTTRIFCELFGSLGATGKGHGSDIATMLGLMGESPEQTDTKVVDQKIKAIKENKKINLNQEHLISFDEATDLILYQNRSLSYHPNAIKFSAYQDDQLIFSDTYYSIGGGFIINEAQTNQKTTAKDQVTVPYPFTNGTELLELCEQHNLKISEIVLANEKQFHDETTIFKKLDDIWQVMQDAVTNGCKSPGVLPGSLKIKRRAPKLYQDLIAEKNSPETNISLYEMDWVNLYALAVNEENAAGGRIVTAPTNGAAGIIPATLHYYRYFSKNYQPQGIYNFLLTAGAIGMIIKKNASISGAEIGCQGEVGSACAMAAAALSEVYGCTPKKCLNAAEIGLEHNLGLTCDPIAGLVQVPCIERNAMASVKAINAYRIAKRGDGNHFVSFDRAVETMRETGKDMLEKYKETSKGGLAVHVIEFPVSSVDC